MKNIILFILLIIPLEGIGQDIYLGETMNQLMNDVGKKYPVSFKVERKDAVNWVTWTQNGINQNQRVVCSFLNNDSATVRAVLIYPLDSCTANFWSSLFRSHSVQQIGSSCWIIQSTVGLVSTNEYKTDSLPYFGMAKMQ